MLFQDKPLSVLYIENCLINPPVFPGTQDLTTYLDELQMLAFGGFASKSESSARVGEVLGSLACKFVIAACIISVRSQYGKRGEKRKLNSAMNTLEGKLGLYSARAWSLDQHPWSGTLDNVGVAMGMSKSQSFLTASTQPDVVLENELNIGSHLIAFRYQVMRNFSPNYLQEKLWEGIKKVTGVSLDMNGQPIR